MNGRGVLHERARRIVFTLLASQIVAAVLLAAALDVLISGLAAYSSLVGALASIMPNYFLAGRMLKRTHEMTPQMSLRAIYTGELVKIAFTVALFVIAIRLLEIDFRMVIVGYLAMAAVNWVAFWTIDLAEMPVSPKRENTTMPRADSE